MSDTPDILVDEDSVSSQPASNGVVEVAEWIVRLERRDIECQFRFIDRHGNVNSRLSSAMLLYKADAKQVAKAITDLHPKYKARAFLFRTLKKQKEAAK